MFCDNFKKFKIDFWNVLQNPILSRKFQLIFGSWKPRANLGQGVQTGVMRESDMKGRRTIFRPIIQGGSKINHENVF